jgi:probable Rubsico expression protein CbbX
MSADSARPSLGTGSRLEEVERFGAAALVDAATNGADILKDLDDRAPVDAGELLNDTRVTSVIDQLDHELVGLDEVKTRIRQIAALLLVDRLRRRVGLSSTPPTLHMSFTGNPGTGKTTVAIMMADLLFRLGYTRKNRLTTASRDDLVGQYVGHTAPKTREVLKRAMGGVLFIDEAYNIYRLDNERDYGQETVELLLEVMENQRDDLVVIMAGYRDRMERFFNDVPGISSRIAHHIDFPDYDLAQLMGIGSMMHTRQAYRFAPGAEAAFEAYLRARMAQPRFANGRSVRNALERARMRQAIRLFDAASRGERLTQGDLVSIRTADILSSRVFQKLKPQAAG